MSAFRRSPGTRSRSLGAWLALALVPAMAACIEAADPIEFVEIPCTFQFTYDTTQMTRTASGMFIRDLSVGSGDVISAGDEVYIHYSGWLTNGTRFDQNLPGSSFPFGFPVAANYVIRGFDEGVQGMRVGGCRQLVIPPNLGYGAQPNGNIPGNSTLVFEVGVVGKV